METLALVIVLMFVVFYIAMAMLKSKNQREQKTSFKSEKSSVDKLENLKVNNNNPGGQMRELSEDEKNLFPICSESGEKLSYPLFSSSSVKIIWQSAEKDEEGKAKLARIPQESEKTFSFNNFYAAGKHYRNISQLCTQKDGELFKDIYGRTVFYDKQRFPCFDSYDYMSEDRYFHHFYLKENGRLTRIYYHDDMLEVYVAEDADRVASQFAQDMVRNGFLMLSEVD